MRIKLWIESDGDVIEELGECVTDNATRAVEMYDRKCDKWADKGYSPIIKWSDISDAAARSLGKRGGSSTSDAKKRAARRNGKRGGRPSKDKK
jgi:hypothetical protein